MLYRCICGCNNFKRENDDIVCSSCGRTVDYQEKIGFFDPTDNLAIGFITKLGIDIGAEAAV